jgi:hypothetical protein
MKMKLFEFFNCLVHKLVFAGNLGNLADDCQLWGIVVCGENGFLIKAEYVCVHRQPIKRRSSYWLRSLT